MHFKMNRTNGETSKWINSQKNLSLRAGFEEANTFFGTFPGDHKTFGTWKESFLRKEKKNFCFYLQTTFAARVQGGLVLVLSIQHFRLLVVLVTKSTVSICSLKVVVLWLFEWWMMTKLLEYWRKVMVMVMMVMMMMMNPAPPSGVSAKAMLTGEEYFPASFFCLRASSSWNDDIFDTDSFLRHKMIHLLRSLSLLPHWNLLIFLTCKSKYKNQRTWWVYFEKIYNLLQFIWCFISDIILKNAMYNWLNRLCLLYGKSHSMTKPMDVTFCNLPGFCQSTLAKAIQWQIPDTLTFAM